MPSSKFVASNFELLFADAVKGINDSPDFICSPRGQKVKENLATTLVLTDPRNRLLLNPARATNYGFGVGEFLWYWTGRQDLETMLYYNKRMKDFSDNGHSLNSAYGFRTRFIEVWYDIGKGKTQWDACRETLLADNDSRRALLIINEKEDNVLAATKGSKDVPCTLSLQFFIRDGKLHLHAHMRSNDVFWGLTYDLFSFTLMQELMLLELREHGLYFLELGNYYHTAGSLHIYERHFEDAQRVVKAYVSDGFMRAVPMQPLILKEMGPLAEYEVALRTGKAEPNGSARFHGGVRWMAEQLEAHRRKRDAERGEQVGPGDGDRTAVVRPDAGAR
jgi:thymidylate synthase